jgi:Protein of unknown function (DUF1353)
MSTLCRRHFIIGSLLGTVPTVSHAASGTSKKSITKEQWMAEWMATARASESPLYLGRFKDPMYFLLKPITWRPNPDQAGFEPVEVPAGFVTDLASIPPIFFTALRPDGEYAYAAIVHDYLYWTQTRSREAADGIFKMAMADFNIKTATVFAIYQAVRRAGGGAWKANASLSRTGEKRVLKEYPPNAGITWTEWKKRPGVFLP